MSTESDDLTTQPTATALMERVREVELRLAQDMDALATRLEGQISSVREEIVNSVQVQISSSRDEMVNIVQGQISSSRDEMVNIVQGQISSSRDEMVNIVQGQISSLRDEIVKGFHKLSNQIITLTGDTLDVRTNQRGIFKRLDDLETAVETP